MQRTLVAELLTTPLDIIGDVHGELDALVRLLHKLGYDEAGRHPQGRKLVFVGDLVDRGHDSPGVLRRVMKMAEAGNAQCVVGNHELNALRNDPEKGRPGEGWWYGRDDAFASVIVDPREKEEQFLPFLRSLPIALERDGLRVVHACWHDDSIKKLDSTGAVIDMFHRHEARLEAPLAEMKRLGREALERAGYTTADRRKHYPRVPLIPELAHSEEQTQMGNPVKVLTSGAERVAPQSFYASDKWRMVERVPWWDEYQDVPVVVGHYWRRYDPEKRADPNKAAADMFGDVRPNAWLGLAGKVMCIDYSVGYRYKERGRKPLGRFDTCLAALRVPEWRLEFDDERAPLALVAPEPELVPKDPI